MWGPFQHPGRGHQACQVSEGLGVALKTAPSMLGPGPGGEMEVAQGSSHSPRNTPVQLLPGHTPEFFIGATSGGGPDFPWCGTPDVLLARPSGPAARHSPLKSVRKGQGSAGKTGILDAGLCSNMLHFYLSFDLMT